MTAFKAPTIDHSTQTHSHIGLSSFIESQRSKCVARCFSTSVWVHRTKTFFESCANPRARLQNSLDCHRSRRREGGVIILVSTQAQVTCPGTVFYSEILEARASSHLIECENVGSTKCRVDKTTKGVGVIKRFLLRHATRHRHATPAKCTLSVAREQQGPAARNFAMASTMQLEFEQAMTDFKTMFPDMDVDVIEAILRCNKGAVDATIDQLLAMSIDNQVSVN